MILTFPGNLSSASGCTSNAQFSLYHSTAWYVHVLTSCCSVTCIFEQTSGLYPHISPPLRNTLHTIKGLAKITNCHALCLISWTSADESRRTHPTLGNLLCVGGCEWPGSPARQEENSASAALPAQPSTENTSLELRCQSTLLPFDVMQDGRHQPQVCKHESRPPSITREQLPQQTRQSVGFHLAKPNKIGEKRSNCRCT